MCVESNKAFVSRKKSAKTERASPSLQLHSFPSPPSFPVFSCFLPVSSFSFHWWVYVPQFALAKDVFLFLLLSLLSWFLSCVLLDQFQAMSAPKSSKAPSTFDLLRWPEEPMQPATHTPVRQQPTSGIGAILLGTALTPEEAEALQKKRPNSELKKKEMSGSGIFSQDADLDADGLLSAEKSSVRAHKPAGVSQISFGEEGSVSPRKPTSLPEVAKQRELSGTLEAPSEETPSRKPTSTAKVKELVGSNIFAPPSEVQPRSLARSLENVEGSIPQTDSTSKFMGSTLAAFGEEDMEVSAKKTNAYKAAELSGNNIFKEDAPLTMAEKSLSAAKRREITGNDIFADEKPSIRDHLGGIRKPPGGESSITLV